jgi:hypothetical protein
LTCADAVKKVMEDDSGRSQVATTDQVKSSLNDSIRRQRTDSPTPSRRSD